MAQCTGCGKECSVLFAENGGQLCWLCSSRRKVRSFAAEISAEEAEFGDRRAWKRFPVQIHMKFSYGQREQSKIIFPGTTVNLSEGGMCVEWTPCEDCSGYAPGGVSPDCIFSRYSLQADDADTLYLTLFLSEDDVVNITARVAFVIKKGQASEYLGLSFVDLDEYTSSRIGQILASIQEDG